MKSKTVTVYIGHVVVEKHTYEVPACIDDKFIEENIKANWSSLDNLVSKKEFGRFLNTIDIQPNDDLL